MRLIKELKDEAKLVHIALILLIIALGSYAAGIAWGFLSIFSDIFIILILSWILSFILEPLIDKVTDLTHLSKLLATLFVYLLVFLAITATIFLFIPLVVQQIQVLIKIVPSYLDSAPPLIDKWGDAFVDSLGGTVILLPTVAQFFFSIFIIILLSFYFNVDREKMGKEFFDLLPKSWHKHVRSFYQVTDTTLATFLRVQLIFGLLSSISTWIVLMLFGIEFAAAISFLSGIFAFIPMVGPFLAMLPPILLIVFDDPLKALIIGLILLAIQQIIFNIIGPKLLGNALKLHPAVILLSFIIGAKVGGTAGAIFAIPVIGILSVYLKALSKNFLKSEAE